MDGGSNNTPIYEKTKCERQLVCRTRNFVFRMYYYDTLNNKGSEAGKKKEISAFNFKNFFY